MTSNPNHHAKNDDLEIREIDFGSSEYEAELRLRQAVLRTPLGLELGGQDTATDDVELHLGAFMGEKLVGVVMMRILPSSQVQMRQVAIDSATQGTGVGRKLIEAFEESAREEGASEIVMDARVTAQGFYEKLGYETLTEPFILRTIPHVKMRKRL
jgi:predicted GNAT family N-acyltransferase